MQYDPWLELHDVEGVQCEIAPDEGALQLYTSGTTGLPKGAILTERNLLHVLRATKSGPLGTFREGALVMVPLPMFHVGGCCWSLHALFQGRTNLILPEASASTVLEGFRRFPVTIAGLVPAVISMVLDHPDAAQVDFSSLETLAYGASPVSAELIMRIQERIGCNMVQMFGMTESCSLATFLAPEDHDPDYPQRMLSVGKPAEGIGLRIVDAAGQDLPPNETGEILLSGPNIMKGYWRRPEATSEAIVDGWYHTGDAGYVDDEGYLHLCDRLKDLIISGGENIYPMEVERVISGLAGVEDVAVVGIPDVIWGEAVLAVIVRSPDAQLAEQEVMTYARSRLAGYKCPKRVIFTAQLPRNPTGKVLKRTLRELYRQ